MILAAALAATIVTSGPRPAAAASPAVIVYEVQPGDSLWGICQRAYGDPLDWPAVYAANKQKIGADPNLIYPNQVILLVHEPLAGTTEGSHTSAVDLGGSTRTGGHRSRRSAPPRGSSVAGALSGHLACTGLERLWITAGGNPHYAFIAAEIAMAESGGWQYATGRAGEEGYWQINPVNYGLATYNPLGNARSAIILSRDGTWWYPWTTWTSGAYRGEC